MVILLSCSSFVAIILAYGVCGELIELKGKSNRKTNTKGKGKSKQMSSAKHSGHKDSLPLAITRGMANVRVVTMDSIQKVIDMVCAGLK